MIESKNKMYIKMYWDSFHPKMQAMDDEKAASLAAKGQFLLWQCRIELESATGKQAQAKQEMAKLVAAQAAGIATAVSHDTPGNQTQATVGTMSDKAAQQSILSVFKSVLTMQILGCHSVLEQVMASGVTEDDVNRVSQILADTVQQLERGPQSPV